MQVLPANLISSTIDSIDFVDNNVENIVVSEEDVVEDDNIIDENTEENVVEDNIVFYEDNDEVLLENNIIVDQEDIDNKATVEEEVETSATPQTKAAEITISIPEYSGNWANGAVKKVDAIIDFGDFTSTGKKVEFTLPDGLKFVSIPVPNNYVVEPNVDAGLIDRLGTTQPLNTAITSVNLPAKQSTYGGRSTFGKVTYNFIPGTERVALSFNVRMDAAKYYGEHTLKEKIKVESFKNGASLEIKDQTIHANGDKVVGATSQNHINTTFASYGTQLSQPDVLASTTDEKFYNYTKTYDLYDYVQAIDHRDSDTIYTKNLTINIFYPKNMKFKDVIQANKGEPIPQSSSFSYIVYPAEGRVEIKIQKYKNISNPRQFAVKYEIPENTPKGTYTAAQVPNATIETYDGEIF
ncbi:hypothetical protein GJ496_010079 [Pomphorhynchus laevis]|nr:hypothetical protein GJ496_010079 [Pomphorhynchus laevis]